VPGGRKKIREYTRNQKELENRKVTDAILEKINDNSNRKLEKRQFVIEKAIEFSKELARKGLHRIDDKEMDEFQTLINKMDLDPEADMYIDYMECDLNMTQILGQKRREDPMDPSTHAKGLASSCVRSSFSPRAYASALEDYSRALALYMGDKVVQRPHVVAVAPYVMAHRMEFDKDWASQFTEMPRPRGENMKTDLSRNLLKVIETSFDKNHQMMQLLDNYAAGEVNGEHTLSPEELRKVLVILHNVHAGRPAGTGVAQQPAGTAAAGQSPPPVPDLDHPFLREYALGVIDTIKKKNKWV
jgi:hypothetical protein